MLIQELTPDLWLAVTSEVWDDDFCLEPSTSAPPNSPSTRHKPAIRGSISHDPPFARLPASQNHPSIRSVSGSAIIPPRSPSRVPHLRSPTQTTDSTWLLPPTRGVRSPSTDSFGSTNWGSDQDPTLILSLPASASASPPRPPRAPPSASSSARTARPTSPTAARGPPLTAPAMSRRVASSSSSQPAGTPELSQSRSRTPSLSSCGWSATAEELDEGETPTTAAGGPARDYPAGEPIEVLDSAAEEQSGRWKMSNMFRRSAKPPAPVLVNGLPSPPPTLGRSDSTSWSAPRERPPHSSTDTSDSTVTNTSGESRSRSSIQFAPPPIRPGTSPYTRAPGGEVLAPKTGRSRISLSDGSGWQQYEGATEEEGGFSGHEEDENDASWTTPSWREEMGSPTSIEYRPRVNSAGISFASSAQAFGLSPVASPAPTSPARPTSPTTAKPRSRKLSKRRPDAATPHPSLLTPRSPDKTRPIVNSTSASTLSAPTRPVSPGATSTRTGRSAPGRERSVTSPVGMGPPPPRPRPGHLPNPGSVVEVDDGWVGIVPFPPSGPTGSRSAPPVAPRRASASAASTAAVEGVAAGRTRLFRRASSKQATTPPVTAKTQAAVKEGKRPLSLSNLFSRSTSSLASPGAGQEGRRAPSPSPSAQSMPGPAGRSVLHRAKGKGKDAEKEVTILPLRGSRNSSLQGSCSVGPPSPVKTAGPPSRGLKMLNRTSVSAPPSPPPAPKAVFMQPPARTGAPLKPILTSRATAPTPLPTYPVSPQARPTRAPRPSFPPPRTDSRPTRPASPPPLPSPAAVLAANRLAPPRPVSVWSGFTEVTEPTSSFGGSDAAGADVTGVSSVQSLAGFANRQASVARRDSARRAALYAQQIGASRSREGSLRQAQGHRPSLSLSSIKLPPPGTSFTATGGANTIAPRLTPSPRPTLMSGVAGDRSSSYFDQTMDEVVGEHRVTRRASLSDLPRGGELKIPARILAAQGRIEGDLERVKQFAQGVQDLKALRAKHAELLAAVGNAQSLVGGDRRGSVVSTVSATAVASSSHALATLDIDYRPWWEQADALINLGDGTKADDRLATQAPERQPSLASRAGSRDAQGHRLWNRSSSVISFETTESVQDRQREMLQGVILGAKGSTLPARSPPSPRPPLSAIAPVPSGVGAKAAPLGPVRVPSEGAGGKRASRTGLSGIKEFLMRLKVRAAEAEMDREGEADRRSFTEPGRRRRESRSLTPTPASTPVTACTPSRPGGAEEDEEEDWDRQLGLDRAPSLARTLSLARSGVGADAPGSGGGRETLGARRKRTQSTRAGVGGEVGARMVLTTEAMPGLVRKVGEVRGRLEECVVRLEGLRGDGTAGEGRVLG